MRNRSFLTFVVKVIAVLAFVLPFFVVIEVFATGSGMISAVTMVVVAYIAYNIKDSEGRQLFISNNMKRKWIFWYFPFDITNKL
jgi:hypothetical protein